MVREIGVQPDIAPIAALIEAGDRFPDIARRLAVDAHVTVGAELGRGMARIDGNLLRRQAARLAEGGGCHGAGGNARLSRRRDAKRGWQHRVAAGKGDAPRQHRIEPGEAEQVFENRRLSQHGAEVSAGSASCQTATAKRRPGGRLVVNRKL
jgi:hypothetical protein